MKKLLSLVLIMMSGTSFAQNIYFDVERIYHPQHEPKGLYIVDAIISGDGVGTDFYSPTQYRIYCPTQMVREITDGINRPSRSALAEDQYLFGGKRVVRGIVAKVCHKR